MVVGKVIMILVLIALMELASYCRHRRVRRIDTLILIVIALLLTGCVSRPPMEGEFWGVRSERYELDVYDCSNKSSKYARILRENGYEADILVVSLSEGGYHAVVRVKINHSHVYCDPTNGTWTSNPLMVGGSWFVVPFETRLDTDRWGDAFLEVER
jgi:hypothetical protein